MSDFVRQMSLTGEERIIDLGGTARFWADCTVPLDITIVNLPGGREEDPVPPQHTITLIDGDACSLPEFQDMSFDIAFSNSVIEHVGPPPQQEALAREAHRLAPRHWVQTPSIWFPIEAHTMMPFWWFYPSPMKQAIMSGWRRKLPAWTEMIDGKTVLSHSDIVRLFPNSRVMTEYVLGFPKSYIAYQATRP